MKINFNLSKRLFYNTRKVVRNFSEQPNPTNSKKPSNQVRGPVTYASLGLTGLIACSILIYYNIEKEKKTEKVVSEVVNYGKPALGGPYVLVNQDGVTKTDASYHGKYILLYFGFTYCPDICPSELVKIGKVMTQIDKIVPDMVIPVFISVDPARDTIGQLKHYSQDFHPKIEYLTGTYEQILQATKAYRVYFSKANETIDDNSIDEDYLVDHSIVIYLVSPDGEFLDFFTQKTQVDDIVTKITNNMKIRKLKALAEKAKQTEVK